MTATGTSSSRLRVGVNLPAWPGSRAPVARWPEMRTLAREAESIGVETIWVPDEPAIAWEPTSLLGAIAEATKDVSLGPLVFCSGFRSPALVASMAQTLDEVSGGRVIVGLGSGYGSKDARWQKLGYESADHLDRFVEHVEVVARLLREREPLTFEGRCYRLKQATIVPRGPRPHGPPIWVAGKHRRTMEVAARWADAVNVNVPLTGKEDAQAVVALIQSTCARVGRDPVTVRATGWARLDLSGRAASRSDTIGGGPSAVASRLHEIELAGVDHITFYVGDDDDDHLYPALTHSALERLDRVLQALRA